MNSRLPVKKVDDQQRNGTALSDEPAQIEMDENVDAASMPTAEYIVACPICQEECNVKNSTSILNILTFTNMFSLSLTSAP